MRIAIVSPFVDRRHGTERALSELLERLALKYGCEVHLYSERVEDLQVSKFLEAGNGRRGAIFWHRVPTVRGPHLLRFISWVVLNTAMRWSHPDRSGGKSRINRPTKTAASTATIAPGSSPEPRSRGRRS